MLALAAEGTAEGLWLRAERQTAGRGRMGRDWRSPAGNLYASTLVRLRSGDPPAPSLTFVAAVALFDALRLFAPDAAWQIKWPNDLLADGSKLSGILPERAGDAVVVGIGVNLASHPQNLDRPTTSIAALTGVAPDPAAFLEALAGKFETWRDIWRREGLLRVLARWRDVAHPEGTRLWVALPEGGRLDGAYGGLDADGALRLRLADGSTRVIHAGDVFLV